MADILPMNTSCDPVVTLSCSSVMSPVNSSDDSAVVSASQSGASHASSGSSAISSSSSSAELHVSSSGEPAAPSSPDVSKQETPAMKKSSYDFIFGKLIGEGSFSMVYLAKDVRTEREYAIKVCEKQHILREKKQKAVMREKQIMNILNDHPCPFFIKLYCAFQDFERLCTFTMGDTFINVLTHIKQHALIEFFTHGKVSPKEILERLLAVYGFETLDISNVRHWVRTAKESSRICRERKPMILQHDNAKPHTSAFTSDPMQKLGFEVPEHPSCGPDVAPSDFWLFSALKRHLKGTHFTCVDYVATATTKWFKEQPEEFYQNGFEKLVHRWHLYFVMNYAINGEMLPYINKVGSFDVKCAQFYTAEIVLALEHLKKLGIVHRDLKPENILLDENMHIQITDFGSAKVLEPDLLVDSTDKGNSENEGGHKEDANKNKDQEAEGDAEDAGKSSNKSSKPESKGDDDDIIENEEPSVKLKRRHSFVGTAQYVSPEILTGKNSSCSSDLWALGCIVYQMLTGLTPFHAPNEYMMFQKIQKSEYSFPDEFPSDAKDLVKSLLVIKSSERLGASDVQGYPSVKNHSFLNGMPWETLHECTPPCIFKSKGVTSNGEQQTQYKVPDNLEPGLDEKQMTRLLGLGLNEDVKKDSRTSTKTIIDLSPEEMAEKLELQAKENIWHKFVEGNVILMQGLVNKQKVGKGLFPRRRMLLLTTGPHLYYVDPVNMVLKGEIPWTSELRTEAKSFKMFSINTPDRSYNMEDPEANALKWCKAIEEVHKKTFGGQS